MQVGGTELSVALRACRGHVLAAASFSLGLNLLYLTVPLYTVQIYDRILPSSSEGTLVLLTLAAIAALVVLAALDAVRARVLARSGVRLERLLAARVMDASLERALAHGPAERGQGLRDIEAVRQSLSGPAALAVFDLPWIPIYIGVLFLIHWGLGTLALGVSVLLLLLALANDRATRAAAARAQEASVTNNQLAEGSLRNAEAIRAMDMAEGVLGRWQRERIRLVEAQLAVADRNALFSGATKFVRILSQVLIFAASAYLAIRQMITPGAMFASAILLARGVQPVEQAVAWWRQISGAIAAARRLGVALEQTARAAVSLDLPRPTGRVTLSAAGFIPPGGRRPVLQGVSFELQPGEALGVIGPTAAGKSTLARLVAGVYPATSGEVRIDGANAFDWARKGLGRHIGYVPQDVQLLPGTIAENIARFGGASDEEIVAAAQAAGLHEQVLALPRGYETRIDDHGAVLSGGQRQLIALARALCGRPCLVILDEPNSSLDSAAEARLLDCIRTLKEGGTTVLVISHRISALAAVDRILLLQGGKPVGLGPRSEIMGRLSRLAPVEGRGTGA